MNRLISCSIVLMILCMALDQSVCAEESNEKAKVASDSEATMDETLVERLFRESSPAVVVITVEGRDGKQSGIGTGFFIRSDGLVATNLHVIGQSRPIKVHLSDGKILEVESVFASDSTMDLAILKVKSKDTPALTIGDSSSTTKGEPIVVIGNPRGLKHSVVSGVLSGTREIASREMLQLAIPIEPGNSGGPVINAEGEVIGIVTMKSTVTNNLGFAVTINDLKPLLKSPNTVPMSRWLTIGSLNPSRWETLFGASWKQRAGQIQVQQAGSGFGGRSLCLATETLEDEIYEVAVQVNINEKDGAAGLAFMSDGDQRHFGFYPSSGGIRITRFDGPSVYQWNVLKELKHETLDFDDWNELRVRVEPEKFQCFLNNHLVYEAKYDPKKYPQQGKFGLVKFRHTSANFRRFEYGTEISSTSVDPKKKSKLLALIDNLPERANVNDNDIETLSESADIVSKILKEKIALLEKQSKDLARLRSEIRTKATVLRFKQELDQTDESIDLMVLTLLLAQLDNPDLSIEPYVDQVDGMVEDIKGSFDEKIKDQQKLEKLISYLFQENGFHGSRSEYYHKANSYMSRVLEDREGLPVTLSVLFMALGERLGLNIEGVGLPGHFIVRYQPIKGEPHLIDVFEQGKFLSRKEAEEIVVLHAATQLTDEHLKPVTKKAILERMLMNLIGVAQQEKDIEALLPYYEVLIIIEPASSQYRGMYSLLLHESGRTAAAITQLELLEKNNGDEVGEARIQQMRDFFNQAN